MHFGQASRIDTTLVQPGEAHADPVLAMLETVAFGNIYDRNPPLFSLSLSLSPCCCLDS